MHVWRKIKIALQNKKLSQVDLSKELGFASAAINRWCQNITQPDNQIIVKIAKYLDVSTDFLLGNDEKRNTKDEILREKLALKKVLVNAGYMKGDEDLTDEELERLMKFVKSNKDFIKNTE